MTLVLLPLAAIMLLTIATRRLTARRRNVSGRRGVNLTDGYRMTTGTVVVESGFRAPVADVTWDHGWVMLSRVHTDGWDEQDPVLGMRFTIPDKTMLLGH
jgi:hypothetical protein